jgi:hypothetical protein
VTVFRDGEYEGVRRERIASRWDSEDDQPL